MKSVFHGHDSPRGAALLVLLLLCPAVFAADVTRPEALRPGLEWQQALVAKLSGARPLADGSVLADRSRRANRESAAELLASEISQRGLQPQRHRYWYPNIQPVLDLIMPPVRGQNVFATIPATVDTAQHVVIGAHYDSVRDGPGANDNATGVAAVLAVAEHLAALELRRMHFIIVFFDFEEDDASGSRAFVDMLLADGTQIHSMHNIDMIGWDSNGDRAVEVDMPTAALEALFRNAAEPLGIAIRKVRYNSTDHQSFRERGIDATCLSEQYASGDTTPHHHQPTDTVDYVDFGFVASSTRLMMAAMQALAQGR